MNERICKHCYSPYKADESSADKNIWGFCSSKCENRYDVWEDKKSERIS